MTLTPVGDASSRNFMETFYDKWLSSEKNISPAAIHPRQKAGAGLGTVCAGGEVKLYATDKLLYNPSKGLAHQQTTVPER